MNIQKKITHERLIWFSIEKALLVQAWLPVTKETAITRRLSEPTANEIVLIALTFLETFLLISNNHDVKQYDNYPSIKEYPLIPSRNICKNILNNSEQR